MDIFSFQDSVQALVEFIKVHSAFLLVLFLILGIIIIPIITFIIKNIFQIDDNFAILNRKIDKVEESQDEKQKKENAKLKRKITKLEKEVKNLNRDTKTPQNQTKKKTPSKNPKKTEKSK